MSGSSSLLAREISQAATLLLASKRAVALTGAGISTPSGIPDFRSTGSGLWTRYDPMEVASLRAFRYHPEKFYGWMRSLVIEIMAALPNPAHMALAQLQQAGYLETIITQNIDGLHQRANSRKILEIHGSLQTLTCTGCFLKVASSGVIQAYLDTGEIPLCPDCASILKPDVILFEEELPVHTWLRAQEACMACDLMMVTGSSLEVMPVAGLPLRALENNARLIMINQSHTYVDVRADIVLRGDVAEILPLIAAEVLIK